MIDDLHHEHSAESVAAQLATNGLAPVHGLHSRAKLVAYGKELGRVVPHRDSDADGVTAIRRQPGLHHEGYQGFSSDALTPHTDRSGTAEPPQLLLLTCGRVSRTGGECIVIDGRAVYKDLAASEPGAAEALSAPRTVLFGGAGGHLGSIFEAVPGGRIRVRYRSDDLVKFSPDITRWLPALDAAIERHVIRFSLEPGEGYVLDNHRWLHGRSAYTGDRVMYRLSVEPHPRFAIPSGFALQPTNGSREPIDRTGGPATP